jgi:spore germination protein KC
MRRSRKLIGNDPQKVTHILFPVLLLLALCLSGCWDRKEVDEISFVSGIGIDWDREQQKVLIYAQLLKPGQTQSGQSSGGSSGGVLVESKDVTVFKALRSAVFRTSRRLNYTHNEVLIFGKSIARQGILPFMDFFIRDPEPRPTQRILVADDDLRKILEIKPQIEKTAAMEINSMVEDYGITSEVNQVIMQELIEMLLSKTRSATLPIIKLIKVGDKDVLYLDGTAVFRKDKWIGRMNHRETRGLLWVIGKVQSGIIPLITPGKKVSVEINRATGKFEPELKKGRMIVRVVVGVTGNIGSNTQGADISKPEVIKEIQQQTEREVRREIFAAVAKARGLHADIFGFGEAFYRKYPRAWQTLEPKWSQLFPEVQVYVQVKAVLRRNGETLNSIM